MGPLKYNFPDQRDSIQIQFHFFFKGNRCMILLINYLVWPFSFRFSSGRHVVYVPTPIHPPIRVQWFFLSSVLGQHRSATQDATINPMFSNCMLLAAIPRLSSMPVQSLLFFFSFERVLVFTEIMHALYSFTKIPHMHALPLIYATPISWRFCQCDGSRDSDSS
jgi:hypothetical protein